MPENLETSPRRSPLRIVLLLTALAVGGGVLWFASQPNRPPNVGPVEPTPTIVPPANNNVDNKLGDPENAATYTLYVPNADAMLSAEKVTDASTPATAPYGRKASRALVFLFKKLEFLPKGTRVLEQPRKLEDGTVRVNLSKEFLQLDTEPETPVLLVLDSMSSTLGAVDIKNGKPGEPARMRVAVEGKSVSVLSQFSLEDPWKTSQYEQPSDGEDAV